MPRLKLIIRSAALAPAFFATIIAVIAFSNAAFAGKVELSGISQTSLLDSCTKSGGNFRSSDEGFSCATSKGSVSCTTSGKCTGECDTCGKSASVKGENGSPIGVLSGTTLKESGVKESDTAPTKATGEPVKTAEPVKTIQPLKTTEPVGGKKPIIGVKKGEVAGSEDHHTKK